MNVPKLTGFVAATHTPFEADGRLNLKAVEKQAAHMLAHQVPGVFIMGTTGECHSLSLEERLALTQRWIEVTRSASLPVIVHVGANCLSDARVLAADAQKRGAAAIAALAPSYFKPRDVGTLVDCMAQIASAAPQTPFYYYDIPPMTGVPLPMADFLDQAAGRIPNLVGLKFSNPDLLMFQLCLRRDHGRFAVLWGSDESLLAALALGGTGAVGSTYNFAAPIYLRLIQAFRAGELETARREQFRSVQCIQLLASFGFMGAAKATMRMLGVEVGPARLPQGNPTPEQGAKLQSLLENLGFFDWIRV